MLEPTFEIHPGKHSFVSSCSGGRVGGGGGGFAHAEMTVHVHIMYSCAFIERIS